MEPTNTTTVPNRSRSMILQPDDIVALTAEKAIAHIQKRPCARSPAKTPATPDGSPSRR